MLGAEESCMFRGSVKRLKGGPRMEGEPTERLLAGRLKTWRWSLGGLVVTSYLPRW